MYKADFALGKILKVHKAIFNARPLIIELLDLPSNVAVTVKNFVIIYKKCKIILNKK